MTASLTTVLSGINSIGLFASRAFVSAFAIAALLKWGPQIGWINNTGLLQRITNVPTWFTHDITVAILGLLAALEIAATKSSDARALLNEIDSYIKSGTAFLTMLVVGGVISSSDASVIKQITAWAEPSQAGFIGDAVTWITAMFSAAAVWFTCVARRELLDIFCEADPDDDTMVMGVFSWAEDLWALVGTLMLILFPLVMLGITVLLLGLIALLQWRAKRREEQSKIDCPACSQPMYRSAVSCGNCGAKNEQVHAIGWLGQSKDKLASDPQHQPEHLIQKKHCPVCATHLASGHVRQTCPACGHELFRDSDESDRFLKSLDQRLPAVLVVTALLSLVPIVGVIPAIITFRLRLIAPLRRYTSTARAITTRWGLRILFIMLVWLQAIPVIGAFSIPIMAVVSYTAYRRIFLGQLERERTGDS